LDSFLYPLHLLQKHRDKIHQPFSCAKCDEKFETEKSKELHVRSNHSYWLQCQTCKEYFSNMQSLIAHDVRQHNSKKYFHCPFCPRIYLSTHGWEKHMKINHNKIYNQGIRHYNEKKFIAFKKNPILLEILPESCVKYFVT
jgi:uncharacterized C2H2 Zn-finger protein